MIQYPIGTSGQSIVLTGGVVDHLLRHRQIGRWRREAGGQLFARIEGGRIEVVEATGPRRGDRRTRASYVPDRKAERAEITERHARGLCFVGDWHTHPDAAPRPSPCDLDSMAECVTRSAHQLNGFLLLIVGLADPPGGFHASIHDGSTHVVLTAGCEQAGPLAAIPASHG